MTMTTRRPRLSISNGSASAVSIIRPKAFIASRADIVFMTDSRAKICAIKDEVALFANGCNLLMILLRGRTAGVEAIKEVEWHPGELYPRVGFIVTNAAMRRMGIGNDEMNGHGFRAVERHAEKAKKAGAKRWKR
jgi:hypothetical protein